MAGKIPLEKKSFSGGFTDNLYGARPNQFAYNDNLLIDQDEKAYSRPGSTFVVAALPQVSGGSVRINRLLKLNDESRYFLASGANLDYLATASTWGTLTIPRTTGTRISYSEWRSHLILTYDDLSSRPSRVSAPTSGGTPIIDLCGLPVIPETDNFVTATLQTAANTLANEIRTDMLAHMANAISSYHRAADTVAAALITTASATNLATLLALTGEMLKAHVSHAQTNQTSSLVHYLQTPDSSVAEATEAAATLASYEVPTTLVEAVARLNNLKSVYNTHIGESIKHSEYDTSHLVTTAFITTATQGPSFPTPEVGITAYALKIRTAIVAHYASSITATGISIPSSAPFPAHPSGTDTLAAPATITQDTLADYIYNLRYSYYQHDQDAEKASSWSYHDAQEASDHSLSRDMVRSNGQQIDLVGGVFGGNYTDMVTVLNDLKNQLNEHIADLTAHYDNTPVPTTGFDLYPTDAQFAAEISNTSVAGDDMALATYLYAFILYKSHVAHGDTFEDFGPVLLKSATDVISIGNTPLVISNIPVPADATHTTKIYRTTDGGVSFFLVGTVANGTTTFTDNITDLELIDREPLYTTGGVVERDAPPKCKSLHVVDDTGYYGNITDSGGISYPNRIVQSVPGNPFAAPEDFYVDLEDEVRGISSVRRTIPIAFCKDSFHRLEGKFDELGRGQIVAETISNSVGLVSENSIVKVENGLIFAGTDGFYFTDGFQAQKITNEWNLTYQAITATTARASQITGTYDSQTKRVYWGVQRSSTSSDNDQILCLDLNFPLGVASCWTSWSNTTHFAPTALMMLSDELIRADRRGYWFKHQTVLTEDKHVNPAIAGSLWGTQPISIDLQSTQDDFGSSAYRKWGTKLDLCLENLTDLNLAIQVNIDDYRKTKALTPVAHTTVNYTAPDDVDFGTPSDPTPKTGNVNLTRHFPSGTLRFTHKQLRFTNDVILIEDSSVKGAATPSGAANTVTLNDATKAWLTDPTGYFISFSGDSYATEYEIIRRNSATVITVTDSGNVLPSVSQTAWKIRGKKKGQKIRILSYAHYAQMMDSPDLSPGDSS